MTKVKSAKDILISTDFLAAREKAAKYVQHEFQDYALRLANDLGDVGHKLVYFKLARTVDRTLLEQAAAFALGYFDEPNKGKLFMWKVQQLRRLSQQKKDMQNKEHDFVMAKSAELINELDQVFLARYKADFESSTQELLDQIVAHYTATATSSPEKTRILLVGVGAGYEAQYLCRLGFKVTGIEISSKLLKVAKQRAINCKLVRKKHFLENSFKDEYFDLVIMNQRLWGMVPLAAESSYVTELRRVLRPRAPLYLGVDLQDTEKEDWQKFDWQEQTFIRFSKQNHLQTLLNRFNSKFGEYSSLATNYIRLISHR